MITKAKPPTLIPLLTLVKHVKAGMTMAQAIAYESVMLEGEQRITDALLIEDFTTAESLANAYAVMAITAAGVTP